jgi:histidine triad (HIT) family protein
MDSIFTKIINGQIPAHYVYQGKDAVAFLDIHPIRPGHTLVVPKKQIGSYIEMSPGDFKDLMGTAQMIAGHIKKTLGCKQVVLNIDGSDTPDHVHVHLVPINEPEDSHREGRMEEEPDHQSLSLMARKLKIEN